MNPIFLSPLRLILFGGIIVFGIAGLIKILSGSVLVGLALLFGGFVCGTIGGLIMSGGKWR